VTGQGRPYVQPSHIGPVHRWVARCECGCGLYEEYSQQSDAAAAVREAAAAHEDPR
jgi:hypothetical protein